MFLTKMNFVTMLFILTAGFFPAPQAQASDLDSFHGLHGIVKISGGTAHIPVIKEVAKQIMTANPEIQISVAGGGSGLGIKQVGEGLVDIGNAGRKATDDEINRYGLVLHKWAIDGVGAVVHPKNSIRSLSKSQIQAIFSGKMTNWKEVGGQDRAINLYSRDKESGTRKVFQKKALAKGDISQHSNIVVSNGAMKASVSNDPYAIGYVSVGHIDKSVAPVALDGVLPTLENVQNGNYPVARGLYSITKGEPAGLTKTFIDFLFSPTGQQIAADKGFIPVQ